MSFNRNPFDEQNTFNDTFKGSAKPNKSAAQQLHIRRSIEDILANQRRKKEEQWWDNVND